MEVHDSTGVPQDPGAPEVELRLPADNAYAAVLRMTATGLAARADFTVDAIEDLRIAVGEAGALLLPLARAGSTLETRFTILPGRLRVQMHTRPVTGAEIDRASFAWQVLTTLAENCTTTRAGSGVGVAFEITSCHPEY